MAQRIIDIEPLLAPIAGENPAGEDLTYAINSPLDQIREALRVDDGFGKGDFQHELKKADYPQALLLCTNALTLHSKDLRISTWLCESLTRIHGFAGLRDGLDLTARLLNSYWLQLFPAIDDDGDMQARDGALSMLNNLLLVIQDLPITSRSGGANYSYLQYQESKLFIIPAMSADIGEREREKINQIRAEAESKKKITSDLWTMAVRLTKVEYYQELSQLLKDCLEQLQSLDNTAYEVFGDSYSLNFNGLKSKLTEIYDFSLTLLKESFRQSHW